MGYENREGVRIFKNDACIGETDSSGEIHLADVFFSDRITGLYMVNEAESLRDHHDRGTDSPWKWRNYITNVKVNDDGTLEGHVVDDLTDPLTIILRKDNALIGFNMIVSLQWDAGERYLDEVRRGMIKAGDFFYNCTDGQMFFENIEIHDNMHFWEGADMRIYQGYQWPCASIGGIHKSNPNKKIKMPRFFDGYNCYRGKYTEAAVYKTVVHEFGHYGLGLYDEYMIKDPDTGEEREAYCTAEAYDSSSKYYENTGYAASIMDKPDDTTNFCDNLDDNRHRWETEQHRRRSMSCWDWIRHKFDDAEEDARWVLIQPTDRGDAVPGPENIPCDAWRESRVLHDAESGACDAMFHFENHRGEPIERGGVTLITSTDIEAFMGYTDTSGDIMMYGVHEGDIAVVEHGHSCNTFTLECPGGGKPDDKHIRLDMLEDPLRNPEIKKTKYVAPDHPYLVTVEAVPGVTTGTLDLSVSTTTTLLEAPELMVWQDGAKSAQPFLPEMKWNSVTEKYESTIELEDLIDPEGFVLANAIDVNGDESVGAARFHFISPPQGEELDWGDAESPLGLWMNAEAFPESATLAFEEVADPGKTDPQLFNVKGPWRLFSNNGKPLRGKAGLSMAYAKDASEAFRTEITAMSIYQWDESKEEWKKLESNHIRDWNRVSASIDSLGIYKLAAPLTTLSNNTGMLIY